MPRAVLTRLLVLAVLIFALTAVPSAPAATARDDSTGEIVPGVDLDLGDDSSDESSDDPCATDDSSNDTAGDDDAGATASVAGDDDTAAEPDGSVGDDSSDDPENDVAEDNSNDDCEDVLSALTSSVRVRLADILRSGVAGGAFRVTGPASVREELLLGGSGASAARSTNAAKVVGVAKKTLRSAGRVHLVVKLTPAGRRAVRRTHGRPKLTLRTTVSSTSGRVQTRTRKVVLRRA
jgi:hypothetical protein